MHQKFDHLYSHTIQPTQNRLIDLYNQLTFWPGFTMERSFSLSKNTGAHEPPKSALPKIRIVLAEDKSLMRTALVSLLKDYGVFEIVGQAADGKELVELLKLTDTDVVLMDIEMPVMNGLDALKIVRLRFPAIRVIMLSVHDNLSYLKEAISLGARGYLTKNCDPSQLVAGIKMVHEKGTYIEESLMQGLAYESLYGSGEKSVSRVALSSREKQILESLCLGLTEKEIAKQLNISSHTVHFHRTRLYTKTDSHNLADLMRYANGKAR